MMTFSAFVLLLLPWLLVLVIVLYLRLPARGNGYWDATLGALQGAGIGVLSGAIGGYQMSGYLSRDEPYAIPGIWAIPFMMGGLWIGESLGTWYGLHRGRCTRAGVTAILVAILILTFCIGGSALLIGANEINESLLLPMTTSLIIPPLARWLAIQTDAKP